MYVGAQSVTNGNSIMVAFYFNILSTNTFSCTSVGTQRETTQIKYIKKIWGLSG